jgi:hypothetical protein
MKEVKDYFKPISKYIHNLSESISNTLQYVSTLDRYYTNEDILSKCNILLLLKDKNRATQLEGLKFVIAVN